MAKTAAHDEAAATEEWLDSLDPDQLEFRDASHVREIIAATENLRAAEDRLRRAVADARTAGDSWAVIGAALGITRQAAFQRFGQVRPAITALVTKKSKGGWAVTKQAARRASAVVPTQAEAVEKARTLVSHAGGGEIVVYGHDGQIVSKKAVTSDPRPRKRR